MSLFYSDSSSRIIESDDSDEVEIDEEMDEHRPKQKDHDTWYAGDSGNVSAADHTSTGARGSVHQSSDEDTDTPDVF
jgi:hypothetical protein